MHELNATQNIVKILVETCKEKNISKVDIVKLSVGVLTTYEKEPLIQYYNLLKKEFNSLSDSSLKINIVPGKILCATCMKESLISSEIELLCNTCGGVNTTIIGGTQVIITDLKIK